MRAALPRNVGHRDMLKFLQLQQSLTERLQVLCETAEQSRDVPGARTAGLLERSELAETDRVKIKEAISEIEKGLFEDELFRQFRALVRECETDFSNHQNGYDQSINQQESKLRIPGQSVSPTSTQFGGFWMPTRYPKMCSMVS